MAVTAGFHRGDAPRSREAPIVARSHALVSGERLAQLGRYGLKSCVIEPCASAVDLARRVDSGSVESILLDPTLLRADALDRIVTSIERAGRRLVLLTHLSAETASIVIDISERLPTEVAFDGVDNVGSLLSSHLHRAGVPSMPAVVMQRIATPLRSLPSALVSTCVALFGWFAIPHRVSEFASTALMERRSLERALTRSGFRGANPLLIAARLARTWSDLSDPNATMATVASRSGFRSARTLGAHYQRVVGVPPRAVHAQLSQNEFAHRLVSAMRA